MLVLYIIANNFYHIYFVHKVLFIIVHWTERIAILVEELSGVRWDHRKLTLSFDFYGRL